MNYMQWKSEFKRQPKGQRLGQAFVNDFMRDSQPDLFYSEDEFEAEQIIWQWITNNQYEDELPQRA